MGMFLTNGIGNQVGMLTDGGTVAYRVAYAPYGAQTVTAGVTSDHWKQNPYCFKNGNGTYNGALVKFGVRWYMAATGTWTQRDTLDAPLDPKNGNRYAYAGNDPINASDPTGRMLSDCALAAISVIGSIALFEITVIAGAAATVASGGTVAPGAVAIGLAEFALVGLTLAGAARSC